MNIQFKTSPDFYPNPESVLALFNKAGIGKPNWTPERLERAMKGSSLVISAWENENLVGYISVISDHAWAGYITQLAVDPSQQKMGIGKKLIQNAEAHFGNEVTLVVHSSDAATKFYEAYGFEAYADVYKLKRKR